MTPLRAARMARNYRRMAVAAHDAGDRAHAAVLIRMAMAAQGVAVADDYTNAAA